MHLSTEIQFFQKPTIGKISTLADNALSRLLTKNSGVKITTQIDLEADSTNEVL